MSLREERFRADYVRKLTERAEFVTCRLDDGKLGGLVAFYGDQPAGGFGFVTLVAVLPECRGAGLAQRMMEEVAAVCRSRGLSELRLMVNGDNEAALALYERQGFARGAVQGDQIAMRLLLS